MSSRISVREAAKRLGLVKVTVNQLIVDGAIRKPLDLEPRGWSPEEWDGVLADVDAHRVRVREGQLARLKLATAAATAAREAKAAKAST